MSGLRLLVCGVLLFEAACRAGLFRRRPTGVATLSLFGAIAAVATGGHFVYRPDGLFLAVFGGLASLHAIRVRLRPAVGSSLVMRHRYTPAAAVLALTVNVPLTALVFAILGCSRRNLRTVLRLAGRAAGPLGISAFDADQILPDAVRYDRPQADRREDGFTMLEALVSLTILATVSASIFTVAATRAARLRQIEESARAREACVSHLERLTVAPLTEALTAHGTTFPAPGEGEGRVEVEPNADSGLLTITVTVPRRGATPIRMTTVVSERVR